MKKVAIALGVLLVLAAVAGYNVWRASEEPVKHTPNELEQGRIQLHAQLDEAKKIESEAEKQSWSSPVRLENMIKGHQERIEKLAGNKEAGEIIAYDQNSIDRLQKRIDDLAAQEEAREAAEAAAAQQAAASPSADQQ